MADAASDDAAAAASHDSEMDGAATVELPHDEFKAASKAAPVGWAFDTDERWGKLAALKWRELSKASGCSGSAMLANVGKRAVAAAIALTFWPEYFDKNVDAARAFGAPPKLLSRRLPAIKTLIEGETPTSFALPPGRLTPYPDGLAVPRLAMPTVALAGDAELAADWQRERDLHADNEARRRKRVRAAADEGDARANAIMDAEMARGKRRRDIADGGTGAPEEAQPRTVVELDGADVAREPRWDYLAREEVEWEKRDAARRAERERQRLSKADIRAWRGWKGVNTYKTDVLSERLPRAHKTTAHPYGGSFGKNRWPWNPYTLPPELTSTPRYAHYRTYGHIGRLPEGYNAADVEAQRVREMERLKALFATHGTTKKPPPPPPPSSPPSQPSPQEGVRTDEKPLPPGPRCTAITAYGHRCCVTAGHPRIGAPLLRGEPFCKEHMRRLPYKKPRPIPKSGAGCPKPNDRCGKCKQLGHWRAHCPNAWVPGPCNICGAFGHFAYACDAHPQSQRHSEDQ